MILKPYSVDKVAEILDLSPSVIYRLINTGKLVASNVSSGERASYRVAEKMLEKFLEQQQVQPVQPTPKRTRINRRKDRKINRY